MICSALNLPNQHPTPSLPSWWSHSHSTHSFKVPEETVDKVGRVIAHPGWISRFRYFSPAPFATQKKLGVCLLSPPTPRFGFDPPLPVDQRITLCTGSGEDISGPSASSWKSLSQAVVRRRSGQHWRRQWFVEGKAAPTSSAHV